jgi:hypothetical protein
MDGRVALRATIASAIASDEASSGRKKALVFNTALALIGLEDGEAKEESQHQFDSTTETCALLTKGCACYHNRKN